MLSFTVTCVWLVSSEIINKCVNEYIIGMRKVLWCLKSIFRQLCKMVLDLKSELNQLKRVQMQY